MNDELSIAMPPITITGNESILAILKYRAQHPDLWAAQWPDDPRLMAVHERFSRILLHYCGWPNAFFIPEDNSYTILDAGEFDSLDLITVVMTIE